MLELGAGFDRRAVCAALVAGRGATIHYRGVLSAEDIRQALLGVRDAGSPADAQPLLAWLASHPHTPEDAQRDLLARGPREVLMNLCLHPTLADDVRSALAEHEDPEVRRHAQHVFSRPRAR